jgi:hypothetical protein
MKITIKWCFLINALSMLKYCAVLLVQSKLGTVVCGFCFVLFAGKSKVLTGSLVPKEDHTWL